MSARRTLLTNIFSLSGIQVVNYALPVLTVPYIVRVIGPDYYGLVNFAQAFTAYFILIVSYGFDFTATREVAIYRDDKEKLSEIFSSVIAAKVLLFLLTLFIFLPIVFLIPKFRADIEIYVYAYLVIIGMVLMPTWLFQGKEKLARLSLFNFFIKLLYAVSIFIFIKNRNDYLLIPLIFSVAQIIVGGTSYVYAVKVFGVSMKFTRLKNISSALKDGWKLFLSTVSINLYTTSNVVILGILGSNLSVGYFAAAGKIITVIQGLLLMPMNQSFYPRVASIMNESKEKAIILLKKLTVSVGLIMFLASVIILIFSDFIIRIVFGGKFMEAAECLKIMAFAPFFIGISIVLGNQALLALKMDKYLLIITSVGAGLSISLNIILVPVFLQNGAALSWLITEFFIMICFYLVLLKKKINLIDLRVIKSFPELFKR
jgi:O-antigen/teichoic acid export membrane protein